MMNDTLFFKVEDPCGALEKVSIIDECFDNALFCTHHNQPLTLDIYLHGICGVFALALNKEFGYRMWIVAEESYEPTPLFDRLIHIYCVHNNTLIDVRGATENKKRFFDEFSDFLGNNDDYFEIEPDVLLSIIQKWISKKDFSIFYQAAKTFIRKNHDSFSF